MSNRPRNNFVEGFNYYVPSMQAGADMAQLRKQRISFANPVVADVDAILAAQSIAAAVDTTTFHADYTPTKMSLYGRNITVVASGAATSNVTVIGRDYLGQPMRESFTLNGTTPVTGLKAFKYVDRITAGLTAGTTINVGWGTRLGLPYKTRAVNREYTDQVVASAGTLTAPVLTDPQTATTGDPRGTYIPTTTPDGTKVLEIDAELDGELNAAGRGGLHGIAHFNV